MSGSPDSSTSSERIRYSSGPPDSPDAPPLSALAAALLAAGWSASESDTLTEESEPALDLPHQGRSAE